MHVNCLFSLSLCSPLQVMVYVYYMNVLFTRVYDFIYTRMYVCMHIYHIYKLLIEKFKVSLDTTSFFTTVYMRSQLSATSWECRDYSLRNIFSPPPPKHFSSIPRSPNGHFPCLSYLRGKWKGVYMLRESVKAFFNGANWQMLIKNLPGTCRDSELN